MSRFRELNAGVYAATTSLVELSPRDFDWLKDKCLSSPKKRVRICAHHSSEDLLHEMFIVLAKTSSVRAHKHLGKSESIHVIEGEADLNLFDDNGTLENSYLLSLEHTRYFRISEPKFHTLAVRTDFFLFHEVTMGPFVPKDTVWAPWTEVTS